MLFILLTSIFNINQIHKTLDNYDQKISHLKALYHLASADKSLAKIETTYIRMVAEYLGIKPEVLEGFDGSEPVLDLPDKEYKIYALFHRLAIIIMIDDKLDEKERHYCFNLGIKMGLHPNAIGEIIDFIRDKGVSNSYPKDIMNIFRKYLN